MSSRIVAVGRYVPRQRLTNADLEKTLNTSDEWLVTRTGMRERRIAAEDEYTSDLAVQAVQDLAQKYPGALDDIGMVVTASMTPDYYCPNVSSQVQSRLGLTNVGVIDLNCACAGFAYAIAVADGLLSSGACRKVLVIGAETMSKIMDYQDRTTCVLFGDGAGAFVMESAPKGHGDLLGSYFMADGDQGDALYCNGISTKIGHGRRTLAQDGPRVFRWAISTVVPGVRQLLASAQLTVQDVDWFVPHSANVRIVNYVADKLELPRERMLSSLEYFANTASASIPLAFSEAIDAGVISRGSTVVFYGFGGGLTQAGVVMRLSAVGV